jgi:hypothetical protein
MATVLPLVAEFDTQVALPSLAHGYLDIRVKEDTMSAGLFALSCPSCGTELEVKYDAVGACTSCGSSYLIRFGHLIPTSSTPQERVALLSEG